MTRIFIAQSTLFWFRLLNVKIRLHGRWRRDPGDLLSFLRQCMQIARKIPGKSLPAIVRLVLSMQEVSLPRSKPICDTSQLVRHRDREGRSLTDLRLELDGKAMHLRDPLCDR